MISALKRLVTTNDNAKDNNQTPANPGISVEKGNTNSPNANASSNLSTASLLNNGMQMISQSLQKKFSKGVNYNSKIRKKNIEKCNSFCEKNVLSNNFYLSENCHKR